MYEHNKIMSQNRPNIIFIINQTNYFPSFFNNLIQMLKQLIHKNNKFSGLKRSKKSIVRCANMAHQTK